MLTDHTLGVLGLVVGVVGVVAGIIGAIYAVRSEQKVSSAREAAKRVERKFRQYMAAQEFTNLTAAGNALIQAVRNADWQSLANAANSVRASLLKARGSHKTLLYPLEQDKLDVVVSDFQQLMVSVPLQEQVAVSEDQTKQMLLKCQGLTDTLSELAGRLGVESMLEPEEPK